MHRRILPTALLIAAACTADAEESSLEVELNKLEPQNGGCRVYLVFDNGTASAFDSLKLDLVVFGTDGVISRRLAIESAPLAADKTTVKLFDLAEVACPDIGRILLNDVLECRDADGDRGDCLDRLYLGSRAGVPFLK